VTPKIAYLLHRFPGVTDTFIRREILWLKQSGMSIHVISVRTPTKKETTERLMREWRPAMSFLLPASKLSLVLALPEFAIRSPGPFLAAAWLAWRTAKPGIRGAAMQLAYFVEAVLAARIAKDRGITHFHNHIGDQSGTVTMLAATLAGIGYSITFHGWPVFFNAENDRVGEKVNRAIFTRSISFFCRSQLMFFAHARDPERFKIVHCGIDIGAFAYRPPRRDVKRLLCVARVSFEKGLGFLVEAVDRLHQEGCDIELHLAGDGPDRPDIEAMIRKRGLENRIKVLGFLTENEVRAALDQADAFVLPSFIEGVPVSAMEAMAIGVPVIATNVGGTSELVEDGVTGLLIRPADVDSICAAVLRLKNDPDLARRLAEQGRKKVEAEFDGAVEFAKLKEHFAIYGITAPSN
jgi:colanic acid/amylovoran biosynthesis glycosyltransferase